MKIAVLYKKRALMTFEGAAQFFSGSSFFLFGILTKVVARVCPFPDCRNPALGLLRIRLRVQAMDLQVCRWSCALG